MEQTFRPGMSAATLRETVSSEHGVSISPSYAKQFVGLHQSDNGLTETQQNQELEIFRLQESISRLEQALYSTEWTRMALTGKQEFTRSGLQTIVELARLMKLKNPVIKRGVEVQRLYVWAQGVAVAAEDDAVNDALQSFLDDERNRAELTTHQARGEKEEQLQSDANIFFRFFTNARTGRVRVRSVLFDEIVDIICNPEDSKEAWLYQRAWTQTAVNGKTIQREEYYPDFRFNPRNRARIEAQLPAGAKVDWSTPIYHLRTNPLGKYGVCEFYAAIDWAAAYKTFLEQLATVWRALARWAAMITTKGGSRGVSAAKTKLATTDTRHQTAQENNVTTPDYPTAQTFLADETINLQPFRTAGATMSADDGRRLFLMAAMIFGFPETFYADVSVGTLATAKSLDRPTELKIKDRQALWEDVHQNIFSYVLLQAVKAPAGALRGLGKAVVEPDGDEYMEYVQWNEGVDPTIKVDFPEIVATDKAETVGAIVNATMNGQGIPLESAVSRLLTELGFNDIDAIMDLWREERDAGNEAGNIDDANNETEPDQAAGSEAGDSGIPTAGNRQ